MTIYQFLRERSGVPEPSALGARFAREDRAAVISTTALAGADPICGQALDLLSPSTVRRREHGADDARHRGCSSAEGFPKILPGFQDPSCSWPPSCPRADAEPDGDHSGQVVMYDRTALRALPRGGLRRDLTAMGTPRLRVVDNPKALADAAAKWVPRPGLGGGQRKGRFTLRSRRERAGRSTPGWRLARLLGADGDLLRGTSAGSPATDSATGW